VIPLGDSMPQAPLPERQKAIAIVLALTLLVFVLELVRRRKLREEYSWLWVLTSLLLIVLALRQDLIDQISVWVGSATSTSTLFFGCLLFLLLLALQFSVRLSRVTQRHRTLGQRVALLEKELERLQGTARGPDEGDNVTPLRPPPTQPRDREQKVKKGGVA
jgi:hypothetical protein